MRIVTGTVIAKPIEQLGHDADHAFKRVGNCARLLENFLLHVVAIGTELGGAAVRQHGFDFARDGLVQPVDDPVFAKLNIDQITLFEINDLIGDAG